MSWQETWEIKKEMSIELSGKTLKEIHEILTPYSKKAQEIIQNKRREKANIE